jgi:hypothetical protein
MIEMEIPRRVFMDAISLAGDEDDIASTGSASPGVARLVDWWNRFGPDNLRLAHSFEIYVKAGGNWRNALKDAETAIEDNLVQRSKSCAMSCGAVAVFFLREPKQSGAEKILQLVDGNQFTNMVRLDPTYQSWKTLHHFRKDNPEVWDQIVKGR